jgi:hypothetical protein
VLLEIRPAPLALFEVSNMLPVIHAMTLPPRTPPPNSRVNHHPRRVACVA